jgi:hypothetical protein
MKTRSSQSFKLIVSSKLLKTIKATKRIADVVVTVAAAK